MLLVDFGSANHREKSATPATHNYKDALVMPHSCHDTDLISLEIGAYTFSSYPFFMVIISRFSRHVQY